MVKNVIKEVENIVCDFDKGIWIGRKPLAGQMFGLNVCAGKDLYHWCIRINGKSYEIIPKDNSGGFETQKKSVYVNTKVETKKVLVNELFLLKIFL